jgi:hypothetical protein
MEKPDLFNQLVLDFHGTTGTRNVDAAPAKGERVTAPEARRPCDPPKVAGYVRRRRTIDGAVPRLLSEIPPNVPQYHRN